MAPKPRKISSLRSLSSFSSSISSHSKRSWVRTPQLLAALTTCCVVLFLTFGEDNLSRSQQLGRLSKSHPSQELQSNISQSEQENNDNFQRGVLGGLVAAIGAHASSISSPLSTAPSCLSTEGDNSTCFEGDDASKVTSLHRGKPISDKVTASDLAKAYQSIKSEYHKLALHPSHSSSWRLLTQHSDGSRVSLLSHPTDPLCPYIRISSIMPGSVQDVWDFLRLDNWEKSMPKMDPFYEGLTVLGEYHHRGIDMVLARKTTKRIVTFGKRDFTFVSVSDRPRADGVWVSGTVSVVTDKFPRQAGYVRAFQDSVAFYERLGDDKVTGQPRTKLTIVFRIDLNDSAEGGEGGYVPMWAYVKTVGATAMLSAQNMKKQIQEIVDERDEIGKMNKNIVQDKQLLSYGKKWLSKIRTSSEY